MRIVGDGKNGEVLLADHDDAVRAEEELRCHLRPEGKRDRWLRGPVRRTGGRRAQRWRCQGTVGEIDRATDGDKQHEQPKAAATNNPALV